MSLTKKLASIVIGIAMVSCFSGASIYARPATDSDTPAKAADSSGKPDTSVSRDVKINEKVKADMLKLLADAKAGKVRPAPASQFPATKGNNLSKTAKNRHRCRRCAGGGRDYSGSRSQKPGLQIAMCFVTKLLTFLKNPTND